MVIPILWVFYHQDYRSALYLFCLASLSDGLDGLLARLLNCTSQFGALMDPVADKLLLMSNFVALAFISRIPGWFAACMVIRDLWIMLGATSYRYLTGSIEYSPIVLSKINTILQLSLIFLILLDLSYIALPTSLINFFLLITLCTSLLSVGQYTWVWGKKAKYMPR
jgi:cardiolipin synthase (CMP-forming)